MKLWLADTGPLLAYLVNADEHHAWAVEQMKQAPMTVLTCEAVITETLFLLERDGHPPEVLFGLVETGWLCCDFDFHQEYRRVRELMRRYREQPMSYADACLVRMAELRPEASVWTLDRHFQVYRRHQRQTISLVSPW
jgi:predicted nucleic acid-binding protein